SHTLINRLCSLAVCLCYTTCAHLDLHSFPTRRSSDLCVYTSTRSDDFYFDNFIVNGEAFIDLQPPDVVLVKAVSSSELEVVFSEDRKSTRLNSSHVKISYAVFCLKKKKHNKNTD